MSSFQTVMENLEQQPGWTAKVGPEYNKIESTKYWTKYLPNGVREFGHQAPAGGGWLSGLNDLQIPTGFVSGIVKHRISLLFDPSIINWTSGSRILAELDNRISDGEGNNYNFSNQINLSSNWMWQVDPETGSWVDTGIKIPALQPFVWHEFEFENRVDFSAKKLAFIAMTVNGVRYNAPSKFSGLNAEKMNWTKGANLQVQMCRQVDGVSLMWGKRIGVVWA